MLAAVAFALFLTQAASFVTNNAKPYRLQPVRENFFLDIAEDPVVNTPKQILGEAAYKSFVASYDKNALVNGGSQYNVIERLRALKLLKATAESGLIEALEEKGLTLSKVEALLPLADNLGLLPLLIKNKDLALSAAPLLIEPAPALLPVIVSLLKSSPATYFGLGFALLGLGAYEATDSLFLGAPLILLGLPVSLVGVVLSTVNSLLAGPVPTVAARAVAETTVNAPSISASSGSRPVAKARRAPVATAKVAKASSGAGSPTNALNGKRKTVRLSKLV